METMTQLLVNEWVIMSVPWAYGPKEHQSVVTHIYIHEEKLHVKISKLSLLLQITIISKHYLSWSSLFAHSILIQLSSATFCVVTKCDSC